MRGRALVPAVVVAIALAACAAPSERFAGEARRHGFAQAIVIGAPFRHVVFSNAAPASAVLHVYLDGDGIPWIGDRPAADPTPRDPLVLHLMRLDEQPSVYVGRPCHHQVTVDPACAPAVWTDGRYSEAVVGSIVRAVEALVARSAITALVWIGYSGGGTLAVLAAPRLSMSAAVVTIAANLDIDGWADWHSYRRLTGSLNPARQPALPSRIVQRHYVGADDRIVPPHILPTTFQPGGIVVPGYDHTCCWTRLWPTVLSDVARLTGSR